MKIHVDGISVDAILIKTTLAGRIFFVQDRLALVDDNDDIVNSIDILDQLLLLTT